MKVRYVQRITRPSGEIQLYLRKKDLPAVRLTSPEPPAGAEAGSALEKEVIGLIERLEGKPALKPSLRHYLRDYELHDANYKGLAESTKALYQIALKEFDDTLGDVAAHKFTPAYCLDLRDAWAERGHRCANVRRQVLKNVLKRAVIAGVLPTNPFLDVEQVRRPSHLVEPHILWPLPVVIAVIEEAIAKKRYGLARAIAIGRFVGARRGDLVSLREAARAEKGRFRFLSGKKKVRVDLAEDPELTAWLARIPTTQPDTPRRGRKGGPNVVRLKATTLVFKLTNGRYTAGGLGEEVIKLVGEMAEAGTIDSGAYDLHGLRHTRGVELALAGCSDAQGAAMMGHASSASFAQYRRQADKIRLAKAGQDLVDLFRRKAAEEASVTAGVTEA